MPLTTVTQSMTDIVTQPNKNIVINGDMRVDQRQDSIVAHNPAIGNVDVNAATTYVVAPGITGPASGYLLTQGAITGVYSAAHTVVNLTVGEIYKVSVMVKLGTATNFIMFVNNMLSYNTISYTHTEATIAAGYNTSTYKELSFVFTATASGAVNLHIGLTTGETNLPVQTNGTVYLSDLKVIKAAAQGTWSYTTDRFKSNINNSSTTVTSRAFNYQSIRDIEPNKFASRVETAVAETTQFTGTDYQFGIFSRFEGQDVFHLNNGDVTVSFKFKSNVSGTFPACVRANVYTDSYIHEFLYNTPDIEQTITFTIPMNNKIVVNDNTVGLDLIIGFINTGTYQILTANKDTWLVGNLLTTDACVNWATVVGNYIEVTDVKIEEGAIATPFLPRTFADELRLCQRYYEKSYAYDLIPGCTSFLDSHSYTVHASILSPTTTIYFKCEKRGYPSFTGYDYITGSTLNPMRDENGTTYPTSVNVGVNSARAYPNATVVVDMHLHLHWSADAEL